MVGGAKLDNFNENKEPGYISPLKYWVQLVTPLVYDDTLSLYELMGKVVKKLNDVIEIVNPLGAGIEDTINEYLDKFKAEWELELAEYQKQITNIINENNVAINNRIDSVTEEIKQEQSQFETEIQEKFDAQNAEIISKIATLAATIQTTDEANRAWTLAQINKLKEDLTGEWPPVIDPSDGQLESLQVTLNHMWDAFRPSALTAYEYDQLQLTAEEYDNKELTAEAYDKYGKVLLMPNAAVYVNNIPLKREVIDMEVLKNGLH